MKTRREFLSQSAVLAAGSVLWPSLAESAAEQPKVHFPTSPRDRIAIASYPFRDFILPSEYVSPAAARIAKKMEITEFAAHVVSRFNVNKIEPWSHHFRSLEPKYLDEFRGALDRAKASVVDIAVDGDYTFYAPDPAERARAVEVNRQWIDAAVVLDSPSIRTHINGPEYQPPHLGRSADTLQRIAEYGATRGVVVHLENDDGVTEDPFFIAQLIETVNSPWLRALPDFGNSLIHLPPDKAYEGLEAMFSHAYGVTHVKGSESTEKGAVVQVDLAYAFGIAKKSSYRGYLSMEYDDAGDPYRATDDLIEKTLHYLE